MKRTPKDHDGMPLKKGRAVILLVAPEALLHGLPAADQAAIRNQIEQRLIVTGVDNDGNVELEFDDARGDCHFIWVPGSAVRRA